jgi:hypothetical protein
VVTRRVERYVQKHFDVSEAELVLAVLRDWRISYEEEPPNERLIAAVVLTADGRLDGVDDAFRTAEQDWRDLLVGAGLANDDWLTVLDARLGPAVD